VRQVAAARVDDSAQEQARRRLLSALAMVYPYDVFREPKVWPRARRLDAAALAIVDGAAPLPTGSEEASAYLLDRLALYRHVVLAAYTEALPLFSRALAIREEVFGHEHPQTMVSLNNLAVLLQDQGNLAAARPLYERALDIREKVLGPEHPDTAISLDNLALLLQEQGDLAAARSLFERALSISEKVLGPDHPDTAIELGNLAVLLGDLGEVDEAEQLLRRAIGIYERTLGADHPITGRYRTHYARMLLKSNRIAEALQFGRAALATQERVAGPDHPWTKDSARFTADALDALGRVEDAKALREKYRIG
jgi:tetratricopeptide (TPR) repeat protein